MLGLCLAQRAQECGHQCFTLREGPSSKHRQRHYDRGCPRMTEQIVTRCGIAGGAPAGMMLGLLLGRAGVDVVVLEKHADFLRDFRGDTIHPSTLEILDDLGLADRFLSETPHSQVTRFQFRLPSGERVRMDLRTLPSRFKFVAFVPQWDFLEFVTAEASRYPSFKLIQQAEV